MGLADFHSAGSGPDRNIEDFELYGTLGYLHVDHVAHLLAEQAL